MDKTVSSTLDLQALNQDAAIDPTAISSEHSSVSGNPSNQYATGLMDELFGEVDGILDGSLIPPTESLKVAPSPEPKAPLNLDFSAFLSTPAADRSTILADFATQGVMPATIPQDHELAPSPTESIRVQARQQSYGLFEKMLIFVGCSSAVAAMVIWLGSQGAIGRMVTALKGGVQTSSPAPNPSDSKFAEYMGKSLDSIDNKNKVGGTGNSSIPPTNLPTVAVPGDPSGLNSTTAIPQTPRVLIGGNGVLKSNPVAANPVKPGVLPQVPVVQSPANNNVQAPAQNTLEQTVAKLSNIVDRMGRSTNPAPIAQSPSVRTATPAVMPAPVAPAPERTLKGILGNGDRSAVMFELNGVTKIYEKGEKIGNSGWVLIRVENGNAIVRRNGEVRTLSVGQRI